jgi:hypothetical protein
MIVGLSALLCLGASAGSATIDAAADWSPGDRTGAPLSPEVEGDDRSARGDGVYGRLSGEVDFGVHLGAYLGRTTQGSLELTGHYYSMAGLYARYLDASPGEGSERSIAAGVSVRPLFVPRWGLDLQTGSALVDLTIDSLALRIGAFAMWEAELDPRRGLEASLGLGVPLMGSAEGLWLDLQGIWRMADPSVIDRPSELGAVLALSWHWMLQLR